MAINRSALFVFLFSLLSLGSSARGFCQTNPVAPGVLFKEAKEKWAVYKSTYFPKLQGTARVRKSDGTVNNKADFKNRPDSCLLAFEQVGPTSDRREAYAVNPQYTFSLAKNEKGWLLDKFSRDPSQNVSPAGQPVRDLVFSFAATQFMVANMPLPDLVSHPSFSIRSIKNLTTADGLAVVHVEFGFKPYLQKEPIKYVPLESGILTLVPSQFWRVLECEVTEKYTEGPGHLKTAYEVELKDGAPLLKKSVSKRRGTANGKIREEEYISEFDLRFEEGVFQGDFYLTAFGLPEPGGITAPARSRLWLWITLGAIASAILAVLYWKLKRRWQKPVSKP